MKMEFLTGGSFWKYKVCKTRQGKSKNFMLNDLNLLNEVKSSNEIDEVGENVRLFGDIRRRIH